MLVLFPFRVGFDEFRMHEDLVDDQSSFHFLYHTTKTQPILDHAQSLLHLLREPFFAVIVYKLLNFTKEPLAYIVPGNSEEHHIVLLQYILNLDAIGKLELRRRFQLFQCAIHQPTTLCMIV